MTRFTSLLRAAAILFTLSFTATSSAWAPLDSTMPRWGELPVGYFLKESSIPDSIASIAANRVQAGFDTWAAPECSAFSAKSLGTTTSGRNYNDDKNVILWLSGSWPAELGDVNSVIGVTAPVWTEGDLTFTDADIAFNNVGFDWDDSGNSGVDTQSIATHEQGHFLGLDHAQSPSATMAPFYPGDTSQRSLVTDDINGVCSLYPSGSGSGSSSSSTGSGTVDPGDCDACLNDASGEGCIEANNDCASSNSCIGFVNCAYECQTQDCVTDCADEYPQGAGIYADLISCLCSECAAECESVCGPVDPGTGSGGAPSSGSGAAGGATSGSSTGSGGASSSASGSGSGGASTPEAGNDAGSGDDGCSVGAPLGKTPLAGWGFVMALLAFLRRGRTGARAPTEDLQETSLRA